MSGRRKQAAIAGFVLSVSLFAVSVAAYLLSDYYSNGNIQLLGEIFGRVIEEQPEAEPAILLALKEYGAGAWAGENVLLSYGYGKNGFLRPTGTYAVFFVLAAFLAAGAFFGVILALFHRRNVTRVRQLTDYLERVNTGNDSEFFRGGEDEYSRLQDEIYKTVTELYQTRDMALKAKENFAENLYNIAHQIKTPITAMSLSVQMMRAEPSEKYLEQISQQLSRLMHLEEALLLLSRVDAGTIPLEKKRTDVFTVLMLAADNLQALFQKAKVSIDVPEAGEILIYADLEWTMEAVMNLMKNCMEHSAPGGCVYCSYEKNLLYTQIRIWDTGSGFEKEDLPHLFERFYRGHNEKSEGIGIGLALSKAIIESQNGTLTACNLPEGGACFEIHFYSH